MITPTLVIILSREEGKIPANYGKRSAELHLSSEIKVIFLRQHHYIRDYFTSILVPYEDL